MQTVLVAGATGYMGRYLVSELHRRGYRVKGLVRSRERAEQRGEFGAPSLLGLVDEWVVADVGNGSEMDGLCDGVDRVVSALGVTRQRADPWDIDFRANLRLLALAERSAVSSFLYVNVMHAHEGTSMLMRSKAAFVESLRRSTVASQVINPSGYFSDASEFVDMARRGFAFGLGEGGHRLNLIHGADLAAFCIDHLGDESGQWDVGGPEVYSYHEIVDLAFAAVGKHARTVRVPVRVVRPTLWVADRLGPRMSSLTRFFLEGLQRDSVGEQTGTHHLAEYFNDLAVIDQDR
ncbi:SDR family oxidoreductase [Rhodococcus sp. IEGM 1318]|uniref:SDR family oxidoreductase n=1 Tax=Rhodococcus sp. IEGM 1318 TaxID=3082226 RepID=UPI002955C85A|nr:NAD(P)H-binding protein [Rhodococcus sp. IEGM 1318]MDV8009455.1 NAD(P)H-binding protein [Rhodococcus sp. IEGM 1318]